MIQFLFEISNLIWPVVNQHIAYGSKFLLYFCMSNLDWLDIEIFVYIIFFFANLRYVLIHQVHDSSNLLFPDFDNCW